MWILWDGTQVPLLAKQLLSCLSQSSSPDTFQFKWIIKFSLVILRGERERKLDSFLCLSLGFKGNRCLIVVISFVS